MSDLARIATSLESIAADLRLVSELAVQCSNSETAATLLRRLSLFANAAFAPDVATDYSGIAALLNYETIEGASKAAKRTPHVRVGKKRLQRVSDVAGQTNGRPE